MGMKLSLYTPPPFPSITWQRDSFTERERERESVCECVCVHVCVCILHMYSYAWTFVDVYIMC